MHIPSMVGNLVENNLNDTEMLSYHSLFKHGFNLSCGSELLFIGDDSQGIVPFGIHLSPTSFKQLQKELRWGEAPLNFSERILSLGASQLDLTKSLILSQKRIPLEIDWLGRKTLASFATYQRESGLDFMTLLSWSKPVDLLVSSKADDFIQKLIGRGLGLTPSGDDFLVGVLGIDAVYPLVDHVFKEKLASYLVQDYTTAVSVSYLKAALNGHFSSPVLDVLNNFGSKKIVGCLKKLSQSGSTSGCDTIMGMYWALEQIKMLDNGGMLR